MNGFFDRVFVINLERRSDRREHMQAEFAQRWPFVAPEFHSAIDGETVQVCNFDHGPSAWACGQSHLAVIRKALQSGCQTILILEDDAALCDDFETKATAFLANLPDDWEIAWLGGEHRQRPHRTSASGIVKSISTDRLHAYALRRTGMEKLERIWSHWHQGHCDWELNKHLREFKSYAPDGPWLVGQRGGQSDINGQDKPVEWFNAVKPPGEGASYKLPFEKVFVLNLKHNAERLATFKERLPPFVGEPIVWPAIYGDALDVPKWWQCGNGAWGCYRSHLAILEHCYSNGIESYVVFEDDAVFKHDALERLDDFMASLPPDWEQIYLGGQLLGENENRPKKEGVREKWDRPLKNCGEGVSPSFQTHENRPKIERDVALPEEWDRPLMDCREGVSPIFRGEVYIPYNVNRTHAFAVHTRGYAKLYNHLVNTPFPPNCDGTPSHVDHHLGHFHEAAYKGYANAIKCATVHSLRRAGQAHFPDQTEITPDWPRQRSQFDRGKISQSRPVTDYIKCYVPGEWICGQAAGRSNINGQLQQEQWFINPADVGKSNIPDPQILPTFVIPLKTEGVGTETKSILKSIGVEVSNCEECNRMILAMNQWGVEGCRGPHRKEIIDRLNQKASEVGLREKIKLMAGAVKTGLWLKINWADPVPGILDEAIRIVEERERRPIISACMPTRGRPEQSIRSIKSFYSTTKGHAREMIVISHPDESVPRLRTLEADQTNYPGLKIMEADCTAIEGWNRAAKHARGEWLKVWDDDLVARDGWLDAALQKYEQIGKPDLCYLGLWDDDPRIPNSLFTRAMGTRRFFVEACGGVLTIPVFKSWWDDNWKFDVAQRTGCAWYCPESRIDHLQAAKGRGPRDATTSLGETRHCGDHETYLLARANGYPISWLPVIK